ncbi:MAG: hypothetical protein N838_04330 [Thiohalocapsa sp. PB-PSB1]|jgi:hypothetical protein|nr:MAG: hypothetical protein N838_04330 [Thiohalocapsa sp. PB-PSB1]
MDYSTFKALQILLFFGSAFAFCLWQLAAVREARRQRILAKDQHLDAKHPKSASKR